MERNEDGAPEPELGSAVYGRLVWKQVFEPCLPPPCEPLPSSERSAGAESEQPVHKLGSFTHHPGGCCFQGDATEAGEVFSPSRQLSHNEIADRLSSTSKEIWPTKRTPTPDSASAAAMMKGKRERESEEGAADQRPMSVPTFNEYEASEGTKPAKLRRYQ
jgi:hypothetical protein